MANDGKVVIDTELNSSGAESGMKKLGGTLSKAGGAAIKGTAVALAGVATGIAAIGLSAVKYNANMEQYLTSFEVMTGSAEKAASVMTEIKDIAAKTPFETTDIVKATQNLMAFGFSADEALASFQTLGDLSQGNAQKLESYTLALGKMESSQKVTLESLNLMIENGFNPLQVISEKTGESMASLYDRVSKGKVSIDEIKGAMQSATSVGGQFYQSMDKQSQTLEGRLSTLKDTWNEFTGSVFKDANSALATTVIPLLTEYLERLSKAFESGGISGLVQELGEVFADVSGEIAEALPEIIDVAGQIITQLISSLAESLPELVPQILDILFLISDVLIENLPVLADAGIELMLGLMQGLVDGLPEAMPLIIEAVTMIVNAISENLSLFTELTVQIIGIILQAMLENMPLIVETIFTLIGAIVEAIFSNIPLLVETIVTLLETLADTLIVNASSLGTAAKELVFQIIKSITESWTDVNDMVPGLIDKLKTRFKEMVDIYKNIGGDIVAKIQDGIVKAWDGLITKGKELGGNLVDGIKESFANFNPLDDIKSAVQTGLGNIGMNYTSQMASSNNQTASSSASAIVPTTNVILSADMAKIFSAVVTKNNDYARGGYSPLLV